LLPPTKLYLACPFHFAAGGGRPGTNSGAKSNADMSVFSLATNLAVMAGLVSAIHDFNIVTRESRGCPA
jgi:hypothetical protein